MKVLWSIIFFLLIVIIFGWFNLVNYQGSSASIWANEYLQSSSALTSLQGKYDQLQYSCKQYVLQTLTPTPSFSNSQWTTAYEAGLQAGELNCHNDY